MFQLSIHRGLHFQVVTGWQLGLDHAVLLGYPHGQPFHSLYQEDVILNDWYYKSKRGALDRNKCGDLKLLEQMMNIMEKKN